ncbi:RNA polymerase sigma-70 factor [Candidatus Poribacteria bacterium]|nr:RNA polymerase sigma-70 factor [Candidatus Poribacteria bacterium]
MTNEDLELVESFQKGEIESFDILVKKYQDRVYDIAYRYTHDPEDAYDLSQEVFEKVFKALGRFRKKSSFYTWLYKITVNACIDYSRKAKKIRSISMEEWLPPQEELHTEPSYSPEAMLELKELKKQINQAIKQLPPKQRAVFIMKRQEGLSLEEIAQTLGRSVGTIKAHLSHATHKLMDILDPYLKE